LQQIYWIFRTPGRIVLRLKSFSLNSHRRFYVTPALLLCLLTSKSQTPLHEQVSSVVQFVRRRRSSAWLTRCTASACMSGSPTNLLYNLFVGDEQQVCDWTLPPVDKCINLFGQWSLDQTAQIVPVMNASTTHHNSSKFTNLNKTH
jgi:hypothetical protein